MVHPLLQLLSNELLSSARYAPLGPLARQLLVVTGHILTADLKNAFSIRKAYFGSLDRLGIYNGRKVQRRP